MFSYFRKLKFVFFGTPEFAAIILEKLIRAGLLPQVVVCNPDKPVGRKKIITPPAVKVLAQKYYIPVLQPENLTDVKSQLSKVNCQFFVVAAYSKILPKEILGIPRLGTIGVHPSLLPKYRGPSPIQTAILNGDKETGVTLFLIDEKVDDGKIIANSKLQITNSDNYEILSQKLAELGADLLIQFFGSPTSQKLIDNIKEVGLPSIELQPQDESQATYTKKFSTQDAYIEPKDLEKAQGSTGSPQETQRLAIEIDRKIRALNPEPGTFTLSLSKGGPRRMKILEAKLLSDGKLQIKKIQFEGKKPVEI